MSIDIASCLAAVTRTVAAGERDGQPMRVVSLSRGYRKAATREATSARCTASCGPTATRWTRTSAD